MRHKQKIYSLIMSVFIGCTGLTSAPNQSRQSPPTMPDSSFSAAASCMLVGAAFCVLGGIGKQVHILMAPAEEKPIRVNSQVPRSEDITNLPQAESDTKTPAAGASERDWVIVD